MLLAKTGEKTAPAIGIEDGADIELTRADHKSMIGTGAQRVGAAQANAVGDAAGLLTALEAFNTRCRRDGNAVIGELGPAFGKAARTVGQIGLRLQAREATEILRCGHGGSLRAMLAVE